jgi:hypothetical protein
MMGGQRVPGTPVLTLRKVLTVAGEYDARAPKLSPENHSDHVSNDVSNADRSR